MRPAGQRLHPLLTTDLTAPMDPGGSCMACVIRVSAALSVVATVAVTAWIAAVAATVHTKVLLWVWGLGFRV